MDGDKLVVRRGTRGLFRFVLLARPPGSRGLTRVAGGSRDTAEQAVAALPDRAL